MSDLYLLAEIAGTLVAIKSDSVESVVRVPDVVPAPKADPAVLGIFALRSRVLTLIDSQYRVTGKAKPLQQSNLAIIMDIAGHQYGLVADKVRDVVSILPDMIEKDIKPAPAWAALTHEIADIGGEIALIVDYEKLVSDMAALAA